MNRRLSSQAITALPIESAFMLRARAMYPAYQIRRRRLIEACSRFVRKSFAGGSRLCYTPPASRGALRRLRPPGSGLAFLLENDARRFRRRARDERN